jgi:hypothetical protein
MMSDGLGRYDDGIDELSEAHREQSINRPGYLDIVEVPHDGCSSETARRWADDSQRSIAMKDVGSKSAEEHG